MSGWGLGLGFDLAQRGTGAAAPPAETFDLLTEDGNALDAENNDNIVTEENP